LRRIVGRLRDPRKKSSPFIIIGEGMDGRVLSDGSGISEAKQCLHYYMSRNGLKRIVG